MDRAVTKKRQPKSKVKADVIRFLDGLQWLNGQRLRQVLEPYRRDLFLRFFGEVDSYGHPRYNLGLFGRAKKNWKSADAVIAGCYALTSDSPSGTQVLMVANDEGQAQDDLDLAKKLVRVNPALKSILTIKTKRIERRDGQGFMTVLPAQFAVGEHGKTFRLLIIDEVHGHRDYSLLEALQPDPTRRDCQTWITSYASIFHKPGVPLFDLIQLGKAGTDPRMLFSWYAADHCSDPNFAARSPEERANPSLATFAPGYLAQQQRRLPAHKFRRLHLNLPGQPEGSAFQPEPVMDSITRGITQRKREPGVTYHAFVDMSGGSSADAVLAIGHSDPEGRAVLDLLQNQGQSPPFEPRKAVTRFANTLKAWGLSRIMGDHYAGETFIADFRSHGITYVVCDKNKSQLYESLEPRLNSYEVLLLDHPEMESQFLSLVWKGGKINHPAGEHDDFSNAAAGVVHVVSGPGDAEVFDSWALDGRNIHGGLTQQGDPFDPYAIEDEDELNQGWIQL